MNDSLNVIMLTNVILPDKFGGLERYVRELSAALVAAGTDVTVICKALSAEDAGSCTMESDGVRVVRHSAPSKADPTFAVRYPAHIARAVLRELKRSGPRTVVHSHFALPTFAPLLARRPYIYTFHAPVYREILSERQDSYALPRVLQSPAVRTLKRAESTVVRTAERLIVLSEFMRAELSMLDDRAAERAICLPGGIDTTKFVQSNLKRPRLPLLVAARRLTPRTGVEQLVEAMASIVRDLPSARLVIIGDGGQRSVIEQRIKTLGLTDSIDLVGRVSDDALIDWYGRADLVIMPTQELEGFGLTSAEAMACGTPVVATPVGANPEVVGRLGPMFLAKDNSPAALSSAVKRVWQQPDLLSSAGDTARSLVYPALSWSSISKQHLALYEEHLASRRSHDRRPGRPTK